MLRDFVLGFFVGQSVNADEEHDETGIERAKRRKTERRRSVQVDRLIGRFKTSSEAEEAAQSKNSMNPWVAGFCWTVIGLSLYSIWRAA